MSLALVRKELREHGVIIAAALVFFGLGLAALLDQSQRWGGRFTALVQHALFFGGLLVMVVSNRLFAREYGGRTQLFLETLPVSRGRVFATKWLLGAAIIAVATIASWYASLHWIQRGEILPLGAALTTLASVLLLTMALWAFAAMSALLGRYRYLAWAVAVIGLFMASSVGGLASGDLPLLSLVGQKAAMAQGLPSHTAFWQAMVIIGVCTLAATLLALWGSGAMASTLAHRMTPRERAFIIVAVMLLVGIGTTMHPKPTPPPFEFQDVAPIIGRHTRASVLPTLDLDQTTADALARTVVRDVDTLIDTLRLPIRPSVFIQPQQGLDPMAMHRAWLDGADGIVLKVAPNAPRDLLRELVLHSVLTDATLGRMEKEDRHVLLDGLSSYWATRDDPAEQAQWWIRAASIDAPITAATLQQWSKTSEHVSECVSQGLAFAAMNVLLQQLGRERVFALMRTIFSEPDENVRVLFERTPDENLSRAGVQWSEWADRTQVAITAARKRYADELNKRPHVQARIAQRSSATRGTTIQADVNGVAAYWVLYQELGPWTADAVEPSRFDARTSPVVLPISPASGTSLFTAIEADDPVLGCPVRVFARRLAVQ
ncbi:MAG: ABC transporter permease [Steroidobacteraceae bacterium]